VEGRELCYCFLIQADTVVREMPNVRVRPRKLLGKLGEKWTDFEVKSEQSVRSMSTRGLSPERMAPEVLCCIRWVSIHRAMDARVPPALCFERGTRMNKRGSWEPMCRTDLTRLFVSYLHLEKREKSRASHPNLQLPHTAIRFSGGFSGSQWLCCSSFAPIAHPWP
jgi:hypothetical protein